MYTIPDKGNDPSVRVFVSSLSIQIICIIFIFKEKYIPYSLNKILYLFILFFFGIAPYLQFQSGATFFGARAIKENEYFLMNVLILFIIFIYQGCYWMFTKKKKSASMIRLIKRFEIPDKLMKIQVFLLLALALLSFFMIFKANNFSLLSMLFRGGEFKESTVGSKASALIIFRVFQPLSMMSLLFYILTKSKNIFVLSIMFLLTLITCFPLGMARFSAAALYLPLLLIVVPWFKKSNFFSITFIMGLLIVFPFLNNFRHFSKDQQIHFGFDFEMFNEGHFDCYQNFTLVTMENIVTYGRQFVGVLLFWVPRSVWPNKPIGSGAFLADEMGFYFSNVSCSYFAEGYINFGFFGIILFTVFMSYITARFDKYYWEIVLHQNNNYFKVIYFLLIGILFFILRGDLMSSFAFTVGFLISILLVHMTTRIKIKIR